MIGQPFNMDYSIDIVLCIDGTATMHSTIDEVKSELLSFPQKLIDEAEVWDRVIESLRVKVIVFRDCESGQSIEESEFFKFPEQETEFKSHISCIELQCGGGVRSANALEAIARAIKSNWTIADGKRARHIILVFSNSDTIPIEERSLSLDYPDDLPKTLPELQSWWEEGVKKDPGSTYRPRSGRLMAFVPENYPWDDMLSWNLYWPAFEVRGTQFSEAMETCVSLIVGNG